MDLGDVPGWIALAVASGAAVLSWRSLKWERLSAEAAGRSADEAARANRFTERALEQQLGTTSSSAVPPAPSGPAADDGVNHDVGSDVSWRIEHPQGDRYVLRNTGTEVAEHVYVDGSALPPINRNLPRDTVIKPGEGHDMLIKGVWGHSMPNQLYVRWEGQPDWVAVPSWQLSAQ